jgi:hypothetical protein
MISGFVLQSTEREVYERRSGLQTMNYLLAASDAVVDLECIPSAIVVAENLIRSQIKLEDLRVSLFDPDENIRSRK